MDDAKATTMFRSEVVEQQLTALKFVQSRLEANQLLSDDLVCALIEIGMTCELSTIVRELSFRYIRQLYTFKIIHWGEVRAAVVTEMGTADSTGCLSGALSILNELPDSILVPFIGSKDSMSAIKSSCLSDDVYIRVVSIEHFAPLLLRVWCVLCSSQHFLEGVMQFESTVDCRRHQEDMVEFIVEIYKNIAAGVKGEASGAELGQELVDNTRAEGACLNAMGTLLRWYNQLSNSAMRGVDSYVLALLGQLPTDTNDVRKCENLFDVNSAVRRDHLSGLNANSLSTLLQHILPDLLKDPYHLFYRATVSAGQGSTVVCLSHLILTLLSALPTSAGILSVHAHSLSFEAVNHFSFDETPNEEETTKSRSAQLPLNVVQLAEEWLTTHLLVQVNHPGRLSFACEVIHLVLVLMQYAPLAHMRSEVYPLMAQAIFRILHCGATNNLPPEYKHSAVNDETSVHDPIPYDHVISWMLMLCPYLSDNEIGQYMPLCLGFVEFFVVDDVARTKLIAECAYVLFVDSVHNVSGQEIIRPPSVLHDFLIHPTVSACFQDEEDFSVSSSERNFNITTRERLVTSLCRLITKLLPVAIARFVTANRTGALLPSTVEDIHKIAPKLSESANGTESSAPDNVFGSETVDLFPSVSGSDIPLVTANDSSSNSENKSFQGLLAGLGVYQEMIGVSLRTLQPPHTNDLPPAETSLEEVHRLVVMGLLVSRTAHRCLFWSSEGLAGMSAQFCYIAMIEVLAEVVTPVYLGDKQNMEQLDHNSNRPSFKATVVAETGLSRTSHSLLYLSVQWARTAFTDLVLSLLTILNQPQPSSDKKTPVYVSIPHCILLPIVKFAAQYLQALFGKTNSKPKQEKVMQLVSHLLMQRSLSESKEVSSAKSRTTPSSGVLGGDEPHVVGDAVTDIAALVPLQMKALDCLEALAYHNADLCSEALSILTDFERFIVLEAKHKHQRVNPLLDQRVRQSYRRIQLQAIATVTKEDTMPPVSPLGRSASRSLPISSFGKSLDVSFKTSLVESYQRSSYTATGTDSVDEYWEEWLRKHQSLTAPGHCDIVDDILRLVPSTIASDTEYCLASDSCLYDLSSLFSFGAFTSAARDHALNANQHFSSICSSDVLALVNDVIDSHVCCPNRSSNQLPCALRLRNLAREVYSLTDDGSWQVISGSSDILTVLATTSFNIFRQEVTVAVRVINSAMFKVPTFSIQVCLKAMNTLGSGDPSLAASFLHNSLPTVQEGVDYFLPGAVVDRKFTFSMHKFCNISVVTRVVYPDLVVDLKSVEVFESIPFGAATNIDPSAEGEESERKSKYKNSDVANVACVDCIPIRIPLAKLLVPYGLGSLSSMMEFRRMGLQMGGIPLGVYQSAKARISFTKQRVVRVPVVATLSCSESSGKLINLADEVSETVFTASNSLHSQEAITSMAGRVRLDSLSSTRLHQTNAALAWCLQSWWGDEIVVSMTLSLCSIPSKSSQQEIHLLWLGTTEVYSRNPFVLDVLEHDVTRLVSSLTAGRVSITENAHEITTSSSFIESAASPRIAHSTLPSASHLAGVPSLSSEEVRKQWNEIKQADATRRNVGMNLMYEKFRSGLYDEVSTKSSEGPVSFL